MNQNLDNILYVCSTMVRTKNKIQTVEWSDLNSFKKDKRMFEWYLIYI